MKNSHDDAGLLSLFAANAVVVDAGEGTEMKGVDAIRNWIAKSIAGLNLHTDIRGYKEEAGVWVIDTILTGDFKASPARFEYFITIENDKISRLRSEFRGSLK